MSGAKVVVSARNAQALDAENLCARAVEHFGRIDTVVATASSAWTAALLRLGKVGSVSALAAPAVAALIGYHAVTKHR